MEEVDDSAGLGLPVRQVVRRASEGFLHQVHAVLAPPNLAADLECWHAEYAPIRGEQY